MHVTGRLNGVKGEYFTIDQDVKRYRRNSGISIYSMEEKKPEILRQKNS